ncbi:MAG TPA: guanylate kinase [Thermoanaerobaculia bacterium]|nr:guanylate kinase [Thermoanaerobaculia bacterium]
MSSERTAVGPRGELFLLSAPSGAGKSTLIRGILAQLADPVGRIAFSISHTTRKPRAGEQDGREYHFVDAAAFQKMIAEDRFLEWAEVHGNYYGTSKDSVLPFLDRGIDIIVDLDVQGAERMMRSFPMAHSIFVLPPSYDDLVRRLEGRGLDGREEIARRLAVSLWEIRRYHSYQYVIVNDDAGRATRALAAIILEKRHRRTRMERRVEQVLADFERAREAAEPI